MFLRFFKKFQFLLVCLFVISLTKSEDDNDFVINNEIALSFKHLNSFVDLKGGQFLMDKPRILGVKHQTQHLIKIKPFRIMMYPVSVASYHLHRNQKEIPTDAERLNGSLVFKRMLEPKSMYKRLKPIKIKEEYMFKQVKDAYWKKPLGGNTNTKDYLDYPVNHMSYRDAHTFCVQKGWRLPTEMEWEFAARAGHQGLDFPWGDKWQERRANVWEGVFPRYNLLIDGFYGRSPVENYQPQNEWGLNDMIGNVWEWTDSVYKDDLGLDRNGNRKEAESKRFILKGGSFMDVTEEYSDSLFSGEDDSKPRISSRVGRYPTYSAQNVGFRCVQSIKNTERDYWKFMNGREDYRIIKLRAPMRHHTNPEKSHFIHDKKHNDEL